MATLYPLKVMSNAQTAVTSADQGGGFSYRYDRPFVTISAGTTVTQMPFFTVPSTVSNAQITNFTLMTGGTAPSSGTMTVTIKKNGSTSIFGTAPTVTTTAGTNTNVSVGSAATTGYAIPVLATTLSTLQLVAGDMLTYDITGGATVTLAAFQLEIRDMSGISG